MSPMTSLPAVLGDHRYALLTTFRRTGRAVDTPIWFAVVDSRVFFQTGRQTGKAKRLRRDHRVRIAPSTARGRPVGPAVDAAARQLGPDESPLARRALEVRYGLQRRLVDLWMRLRHEETVYFEIVDA